MFDEAEIKRREKVLEGILDSQQFSVEESFQNPNKKKKKKVALKKIRPIGTPKGSFGRNIFLIK